jgi:hypothetical protein
MNNSLKRPWTAWILIALLVFQAVSAFYGMYLLLSDPTGSVMKLENFASKSPTGDFLIPGLILGILLGLVPLLSSWGLVTRKEVKAFNWINVYCGQHHWAWTFSVYTGIMLVIWITVQVKFIGGGFFIQTFYSLLGVLILIAALLPPVKNHYYLKN